MSGDHKISSLYEKLTTFNEPYLNDSIKSLHHVILTLCRIDPTIFVSIDTTISITKKFLSRLTDDAIVKYINNPVLLTLFHSRYHENIKILLFTTSNIFPFLLNFYEPIMQLLSYIDSASSDKHIRANIFFIIQLIKAFRNVTTDEKVYIVKRIIIMLENVKYNLNNLDTSRDKTKSIWLTEVVSLFSGLSVVMPIITESEQLIVDFSEYVINHEELLNTILLKIESIGTNLLLVQGILNLNAIVDIVETSKGAVMSRDSRDSVAAPTIVTPDNSPLVNKDKKTWFGRGNSLKTKKNKKRKRTRRRNARRYTRK